ncbi:MAG: rod-binding protein [Variibacter sp.]|nr:rod-binding protein [Variibacter sp.]
MAAALSALASDPLLLAGAQGRAKTPALSKAALAALPGSPAAKAKAASEEFEAVFLSTMFNEMFAGLKGDGPLGGSGAGGVWRSFLTDEYAKSFAKSGGIGIGAEVYKTLLSLQETKR